MWLEHSSSPSRRVMWCLLRCMHMHLHSQGAAVAHRRRPVACHECTGDFEAGQPLQVCDGRPVQAVGG